MRCFVAIELPADIRERLADLQGRLGAMDPFVRWTRPEQIHLTLKFLGEVPDHQVPEVCSAVVKTAARLKPVPIEVAGTGCFPRGGPARVVWVGIVGPPPELITCHAECDRALNELGYPPEDRAFSPHLTLGRSRQPNGAREVRALLATAGDFCCQPFVAPELIVFQSVLGHSGPTYTALAHARFQAPTI